MSNKPDVVRSVREFLGTEYPDERIAGIRRFESEQVASVLKSCMHKQDSNIAIVVVGTGIILLVGLMIAYYELVEGTDTTYFMCWFIVAPIVLLIVVRALGISVASSEEKAVGVACLTRDSEERVARKCASVVCDAIVAKVKGVEPRMADICRKPDFMIMVGPLGCVLVDLAIDKVLFIHRRYIRKVNIVSLSAESGTRQVERSGAQVGALLATSALGGLLFGGAGAVVGAIMHGHSQAGQSNNIGGTVHMAEIHTRLEACPLVHVDCGVDYAMCSRLVSAIELYLEDGYRGSRA